MKLSNEEISRLFKYTAALLELHEENPFKVKSFNSAAFNIDRLQTPLVGLSAEELEKTEGIGKSLAGKILEITETGSFKELDELIAGTPLGVAELMTVKGVGPKKVRTLWKELGIESKEELLKACEENRVAELKGFGSKTQEAILHTLLFQQAQQGRFLYVEVEEAAYKLEKELPDLILTDRVAIVGEIARKLEVVETLAILIGCDDVGKVFQKLKGLSTLKKDEKISGLFAWRGTLTPLGIKTEIKVCSYQDFYKQHLLLTASSEHLHQKVTESNTLRDVITSSGTVESEEQIYEGIGFQFVPAELREGTFELEAARNRQLPVLLTERDLKGIIHNHTTYSDGRHTLEEMALYCRELGYEYLGISDHSQSAFYANGLDEDRVYAQWEEIDRLNEKLAPFKIFKGIESDILSDGSLDYDDELLSQFDFVIASVHSGLNMDVVKATDRLIKAIQNPFTTFLGHPTGRLLLRREGYPLDFNAVIEACSVYGVVIEVNANPYRLDLDWRHIHFALEKNVMLSINPDAHEKEGYHDMHYGVLVGRKGGLTKEMTFNSNDVQFTEAYFKRRKELNKKRVIGEK